MEDQKFEGKQRPRLLMIESGRLLCLVIESKIAFAWLGASMVLFLITLRVSDLAQIFASSAVAGSVECADYADTFSQGRIL